MRQCKDCKAPQKRFTKCYSKNDELRAMGCAYYYRKMKLNWPAILIALAYIIFWFMYGLYFNN